MTETCTGSVYIDIILHLWLAQVFFLFEETGNKVLVNLVRVVRGLYFLIFLSILGFLVN